MLYLGGVALTTIVAGAATAPFALFHFNRLAAYGLAANLVAVPITALWVMPWAVAAYALMPFGLEAAALAPMGWGIAIIIDVAETVAGWPGAVALLPAMPTWGLGVIAFGGLWLCLWRTRWRLLGAPVVALGLASVMFSRPPDILVDADGNLMAVRSADGAPHRFFDRARPGSCAMSGPGDRVKRNRRSRGRRRAPAPTAGSVAIRSAAFTAPTRGQRRWSTGRKRCSRTAGVADVVVSVGACAHGLPLGADRCRPLRSVALRRACDLAGRRRRLEHSRRKRQPEPRRPAVGPSAALESVRRASQ